MRIQYHKRFEKQYKKLSPSMKKKVRAAIELFIANPEHPRLRNHQLAGRLAGLRAISVTGDMRIIFQEQDEYLVVIFINVGTHNQVYK